DQRARLDDPTRRALGGAGRQRLRKIDAAEPALWRLASCARRLDRAGRTRERPAHRRLEAARRLAFARAAGRSLSREVARRDRDLRPLRQRRAERAREPRRSGARPQVAVVLRPGAPARAWPAASLIRTTAARAHRARAGERPGAAAAR